jgi:formamidase
VHYLSGPLEVEGAQPGDLLVVEICDIVPLPGEEWGFTGKIKATFIMIF